jgi:hypothetical protein
MPARGRDEALAACQTHLGMRAQCGRAAPAPGRGPGLETPALRFEAVGSLKSPCTAIWSFSRGRRASWRPSADTGSRGWSGGRAAKNESLPDRNGLNPETGSAAARGGGVGVGGGGGGGSAAGAGARARGKDSAKAAGPPRPSWTATPPAPDRHACPIHCALPPLPSPPYSAPCGRGVPRPHGPNLGRRPGRS